MSALLRDPGAQAAGLPAIDSVDAWPVVMGMSSYANKRTTVVVSPDVVVQGNYKFLYADLYPQAGWTGPLYPNATGFQPGFPPGGNALDSPSPFPPQTLATVNCGATGCLFDVVSDPTEHNPLNDARMKQNMLARLQELNKNNFNPNRGKPSLLACDAAMKLYGGFYGPFTQLPKAQQVKLG